MDATWHKMPHIRRLTRESKIRTVSVARWFLSPEIGRCEYSSAGGMIADGIMTGIGLAVSAVAEAPIRRDKVSQLGTPVGGRQPSDEAIRETARQLGLSKNDVHRAIKVASITPEAQQAAHEVGNRWATKSKQLLAFASRWVQLVGIWWASLIPAGQIVSRKIK